MGGAVLGKKEVETTPGECAAQLKIMHFSWGERDSERECTGVLECSQSECTRAKGAREWHALGLYVNVFDEGIVMGCIFVQLRLVLFDNFY